MQNTHTDGGSLSGWAYLVFVLFLLASYAIPAALLQPGQNRLALAIAMVPALVWISLTDLKKRVIPDLTTIWLAVIGCARFLVEGGDLLTSMAVAAGLLAVLGLIGEVIWRARGIDVLGLGDVKLIGAGALVVGASSVWMMILLASAGGIVAAVLGQRRGEVGIPFGPFLAYAIFITFLLSGPPA